MSAIENKDAKQEADDLCLSAADRAFFAGKRVVMTPNSRDCTLLVVWTWFLSSNPMQSLKEEESKVRNNDQWNDQGYSIGKRENLARHYQTLGINMVNGFSLYGMLVAICRSRQLKYGSLTLGDETHQRISCAKLSAIRSAFNELSQSLLSGALPEQVVSIQGEEGVDRMFGGYKLLERITGGNASVFKAVRNRDQFPVVLKCLAVHDDEMLSAAASEASCHQQLVSSAPWVSRYVVSCYNSFQHDVKSGVANSTYVDHEYWLVMEQAGIDLRKHVEQVKQSGSVFAVSTIWHFFLCICAGVLASHSAGMMHRDLKPSNVVLTLDGRAVKLTDLGQAKTLSSVSKQQSDVRGTPGYISPERIKGGWYSKRADIWALGVVLYELCTLQHPFLPDHTIPSLQRLRQRTVSGTYSPLPERVAEFDGVVRACLTVNSKQRPTISQLLHEHVGMKRVRSFDADLVDVIQAKLVAQQHTDDELEDVEDEEMDGKVP